MGRGRWRGVLGAAAVAIASVLAVPASPARAVTGVSAFALSSAETIVGGGGVVVTPTAVGTFNDVPGACTWALTSTTFTCSGLVNVRCNILGSAPLDGGTEYYLTCAGSASGPGNLFIDSKAEQPTNQLVPGAAVAVGYGNVTS